MLPVTCTYNSSYITEQQFRPYSRQFSWIKIELSPLNSLYFEEEDFISCIDHYYNLRVKTCNKYFGMIILGVEKYKSSLRANFAPIL